MSTFFPGKYLCGEFMDMCKTKQDSGIQQSRLYPENLRFYEDLQVSEREEEPLSRLERLKNCGKTFAVLVPFQSQESSMAG